DQPVAQPARQCAIDERVLPVGAQAEDGVVVAALERVEQHRDVGWIVLQVAVHGDDDVPRGEVDAGLHGGRLPQVAPKSNDLDVRIGGGDRLKLQVRAVGAAVIDQDDFVFQAPG